MVAVEHSRACVSTDYIRFLALDGVVGEDGTMIQTLLKVSASAPDASGNISMFPLIPCDIHPLSHTQGGKRCVLVHTPVLRVVSGGVRPVGKPGRLPPDSWSHQERMVRVVPWESVFLFANHGVDLWLRPSRGAGACVWSCFARLLDHPVDVEQRAVGRSRAGRA